MITTFLLLVLLAVIVLGLAAVTSWQLILVVAIFVTAIKFVKRIIGKR